MRQSAPEAVVASSAKIQGVPPRGASAARRCRPAPAARSCGREVSQSSPPLLREPRRDCLLAHRLASLLPMSSDAGSGVRFETTMGAFVVELYHAQGRAARPSRAGRGYYHQRHLPPHREGFVVQGGDPAGTGGGESSGGKFADITRN